MSAIRIVEENATHTLLRLDGRSTEVWEFDSWAILDKRTPVVFVVVENCEDLTEAVVVFEGTKKSCVNFLEEVKYSK